MYGDNMDHVQTIQDMMDFNCVSEHFPIIWRQVSDLEVISFEMQASL